MTTHQLTIDADRHVIEPVDLWREYLPAPWRQRAPWLEGDQLLCEGRPIFGEITDAAKRIVAEQARARSADLIAASRGPGQLRAMDRALLLQEHPRGGEHLSGALGRLSTSVPKSLTDLGAERIIPPSGIANLPCAAKPAAPRYTIIRLERLERGGAGRSASTPRARRPV
jgi:hypothetical protein